jgi:CDP-glycerol glycerophosphotransferase (TagB/SpsB family)
MKIDKRNPAHWCYLVRFGLNVCLALCLRPFLRRPVRPLVLLYGHKLTGNLKALYDALRAAHDAPCEVRFLTMDPAYHATLVTAGEAAVLAIGVAGIKALARVRVIISDHGLHAMSWLPRLRSIRFADVWHGVPYKGWDANDFRVQQAYDEIWVSSALMRRFYIDRFGCRPAQVHATGYGRTDRLVRQHEDQTALRRALGVPSAPTRLVLFAPTWHHGRGEQSVFPFGVEAERFLDAIGAVCRAHDAQCLLRTHLNTRLPAGALAGPYQFVPQDRYPDTESVLLVSDILICDWSSIAFDFLVLDRPTIFLDVPAPFPKGFTLGPEYRFGALAGSLDELCTVLERYLTDPASYHHDCASRVTLARAAAYDGCADGQATERYIERMRGLL